MLIDKIALRNFRIYEGVNELEFTHHPDKNVTIVSGSNGYGKTTLLTSLVWCLYGKLMVDVDDRYKREIYESGGYKRFCQKTINRSVKVTSVGPTNQNEVSSSKEKEASSFSVSVTISDIFIPSVPCNRVEIIRTYHVDSDNEKLKILIDGRENELTKEVGSEIFINDFILPKEIAKFFFFDAEKIVSLAEIRTVDEKRELSRAYAEVLGIRKYEELRDNLLNVRTRLKKEAASDKDRKKLKEINDQVDEKDRLLSYLNESLEKIDDKLIALSQDSNELQEKLIREGSSITPEELKDLRQLKESTSNEAKKARGRLSEMLELAPFAIAAKKLIDVEKQIDREEKASKTKVSTDFIKKAKEALTSEIENNQELRLSANDRRKLKEIVSSHLSYSDNKGIQFLLDMSNDETNVFRALKRNLFSSYNDRFRELVKDVKMNQSAFAIILNRLGDAETKESDAVIQEIRKAKNKIDKEIAALENEKIEIKAKIISNTNDKNSLLKIQSEIGKKISVADVDIEKDRTASRLVGELEVFIEKFKNQKKASLEEKILKELQLLMHKEDFISRVEVIIDGAIIDVEFYDSNNHLINKDGLSKGEQQLYATALLKALVDESNIKFPLFIDSPLQKFDKRHARSIVEDFYPNVSEQVVLFPLLEKELTEREFEWMLPRVSRSFLIKNVNKNKSSFEEIKPSELFATVQRESANV